MDVKFFNKYCDELDSYLDVFKCDDDSKFAQSAFIYKDVDIVKNVVVGFNENGIPFGFVQY